METNNKLAVFSNPDFGEVRTLEINGEPWFVGKDIADALGYSNPRKALIDHVDEEDKNTVTIRDGIQGNPNQIIINESGLYSLIMSSKMEKAKEFKRWVTSEVLPSIRKTGAYDIRKDSRELDIEEKKADAMLEDVRIRKAELLMKMSNLNISPQASQALVSCASEVLTGIKCIPLPEVDKTYSATEAGEIIGVSAAKIGRVANANGIKTEDFGIFVLDKAKGSNKQVTTFRYNEKGLAKLRELFSE
jgi:prophage antirepressor-like protein